MHLRAKIRHLTLAFSPLAKGHLFYPKLRVATW
jgi:hypothetical protein